MPTSSAIERSSLLQKAIDTLTENNLLPSKQEKIGVAMSGGVDSSVAIALLKEAGYNVFGITGWLMEGAGKCCDGGMVDAAKICAGLGVEHTAQDLREMFKSTIISPFISSYSNGRTPVPCMPCNTEVKWGSLLETSKDMGAVCLASGHYARVVKLPSGELSIGKSVDDSKDQSYMLWGLSQEQLKRTAFPLANLNKTEIRQIAEELKLVNWNKEESQDICFIPDKTKNFLLENLGEKKGSIKHIKTGETLGEHSGSHLYTIGQRKGLGVSSAEPIYVVKIDAINNVVYVGAKEDLYAKGAFVEHIVWQEEKKEPFEALVKIRYNSAPVLTKLTPCLDEQGKPALSLEFLEEGVSSITPGQAAVAYNKDGGTIIVGGWISKEL